MKRYICVLLTLALIVALAGCGKGEVSLYDRGLEVIGLMAEAIRSDAYLELMSANASLREIIAGAAEGDYSAPETVYAISFPDSMASADVPESLSDLVTHRLISTVMTQVNAMGGVETLAASTMCTVGKTFVSSEITSDVIYLYVFKNGCPVAVTFTTGEDNTVSASASIILNAEFPCGSPEEIQEFFGSEAMEVTDITRG